MADRTIDTLPSLNPSLDVRLKKGEFEPRDVYLPARVNARTVKIDMGGDLFVPLPPLRQDPNDSNAMEVDPDFHGAILSLANGKSRWRKSTIVWFDSAGYAPPENRIYSLKMAQIDGVSQDLRDYSDIATMVQQGQYRYMSEWRPIASLISNLLDHNGNPASIAGEAVVGELRTHSSVSGDDRYTKVYFNGSGTLKAIIVR